MQTKRSREGYLLVDNRASGHGYQEWPTFTCSHCNGIVLLNPLRVRDRGYCRGCDSYICDACMAQKTLTGQCVTMEQKIDKVLADAEKQAPKANSTLLLP